MIQNHLFLVSGKALISKGSKDIVIESTSNHHFRPLLCRLTPSRQGIRMNIRTHLILPETRVPELHLCLSEFGSILIQIHVVDSEKTHQ